MLGAYRIRGDSLALDRKRVLRGNNLIAVNLKASAIAEASAICNYALAYVHMDQHM